MKTLIKSLLLLAVICLADTSLTAQDTEPTRYYTFYYMKVAPGMADEYLAMEKAWKKIHQANIKAGKYSFWELTAVMFPSGGNEEYNYVVRTNFDGEKQLSQYLENWTMPDNIETLLTKEELDLVNRTAEFRTWVKTEVWSRVDQVLAEDLSDAKVRVFNYFDFPEGASRADHLRVETEIWKPMHKVRVDGGMMKGWVLLQKELPYGSAQPYHDATVDLYTSIEQMLTDAPLGMFEKVHPGKDVAKLLDETSAAADLIRAEVRVLVDNTDM